MENRSNNCKNQSSNRSSNRTSGQSQNSTASNEHKHPNQYTKGADDESAKNSTSSKNSVRNGR